MTDFSKLPLACIVAFVPAFTLPGIVAAGDAYKPPSAAAILETLKKEHPRLLLTPKAVQDIKALVKRDKMAARIFASIQRSADQTLKEEPSTYELPDGRRLLRISRRVLTRVQELAFVYHMTGNKQYVDRAWVELEAASKFKDWNPAHFLDTAEMTHAFAVGYDGLWHEWSAEQRERLRTAIIEKGIHPAMDKFRGGTAWWNTSNNNWNQVCNGGIGMGALAIADHEPELAGRVLEKVMAGLPNSMRAYAPDGAGEEGVTYWSYAVRYGVPFLASLENSLETDFGLNQVEAYDKSGDYHIYMSGHKRWPFDFGDCSLRQSSVPEHFWMARKYNIPRYAWYRYAALADGQNGDIHDLLWFDDSARNFDLKAMPLDKHFRGFECVSMRDTWRDGEGFAIAIQGGKNKGFHRHLDLGSFILEADGIRWIIDSGKERQAYQRHKNKAGRYDFYRLRAEGHNTLVINPDGSLDQDMEGDAPFVSFKSQPEQAKAVQDLTSAYAQRARKITRTFTLLRGKRFTVVDEISCKDPSQVWSFFHTAADVRLDPDARSATLESEGKELRVELASPANARFEVMPARPAAKSPNPSVQESNEGRRKLTVHLDHVESTRIEVLFER